MAELVICFMLLLMNILFAIELTASILRHVYLRSGIGVGHLTRVYGGILLSFVIVLLSLWVKRRRSDLEKHLTIKNCDKTFL